LKNVIAREEAAREAHFKRDFTDEESWAVSKAAKKGKTVKEEALGIRRNIDPDQIIKSLSDGDIVAFRDYYVKFEDIIEHHGELKEDYEAIGEVYNNFMKAHEKFNRDEALSYSERGLKPENDPQYINRRNLWAFLANVFTRVMFEASKANRKNKK
ncbi:MAG: hypothetical protein AAB731_05425, partial [Patescibacteria group bacterium]